MMRKTSFHNTALSILAMSLLPLALGASPRTPIPVSPGGQRAGSTASSCTNFHWAQVDDANGYELVVLATDADAGETESRLETSAPALRQVLPSGVGSWAPSLEDCLEPGESYAWAIRALRTEGPGAWSQGSLFAVTGAPTDEEVRGALAMLRRYRQAKRKSPAATVNNADRPLLAPIGELEMATAKERTNERHEKKMLGEAAELLHRRQPIHPPMLSGAAPNPAAESRSLSVDSNIELGDSANVFKDGELLLWTDAAGNNALGVKSLRSNTTGYWNTATGTQALELNTTGIRNTAHGALALRANTTGYWNTANGFYALRHNSTGDRNTATGAHALQSNTTGVTNTATGYGALSSSTTGTNNTATGVNALRSNLTGYWNTAVGVSALASSETGHQNTAAGVLALFRNTTGAENTATGVYTLGHNTTGFFNTASGAKALFGNTTGHRNTATGRYALWYNSTASWNTATGAQALHNNSTGEKNTATGVYALVSNSTGGRNTATGFDALHDNTTGQGHTAVGFRAGHKWTTGGNNIALGYGAYGVAGETSTIRIGGAGKQSRAFIEGIRGAASGSVSGFDQAVCSDEFDQLGPCMPSSRRFKDDIESVSGVAKRVRLLQPVSFRYKAESIGNGDRPLHYGLIAEEVAKVFPTLVSYDEQGNPYSVRYGLLTPLLLNLLQLQDQALAEQTTALETLRAEAADRDRIVADLISRLDELANKRRFRRSKR